MEQLAQWLQQASQNVSHGLVTFVTIQGMGGVFLALILLFLFIKTMNLSTANKINWRTFSFNNIKNPSAPKSQESLNTSHAPEDAEESKNHEQLAAAVAVACALHEWEQYRPIVIEPNTHVDKSAWRLSGRLALMNTNLHRSQNK